MPFLFSHILHVLDIPVGPSRVHLYTGRDTLSSSDGYPNCQLSVFVHTRGSKTLQLVKKAAKLIVYLLEPGVGGETQTMQMLRRLVKAVESFLHPSNGGYWTRRLSQLLSSLCENLSARVRREEALPDGEARKLTRDDVAAFTGVVLPLAFQGLYSKNGAATLQACQALKTLALMDPAQTLAPLLLRVDQALTTLTEVHQTSAALEALVSVAQPMLLNLEQGASALPSVMALTLSGIDTNDPCAPAPTLRDQRLDAYRNG